MVQKKKNRGRFLSQWKKYLCTGPFICFLPFLYFFCGKCVKVDSMRNKCPLHAHKVFSPCLAVSAKRRDFPWHCVTWPPIFFPPFLRRIFFLSFANSRGGFFPFLFLRISVHLHARSCKCCAREFRANSFQKVLFFKKKTSSFSHKKYLKTARLASKVDFF